MDVNLTTLRQETLILNHSDMQQNQFRQIIQIGRNVTDIINLPCVDGARKSYTGVLVYQVNTVGVTPKYAREGDFICQDYDGDWHVVENNHQ